MVVYQSSQNAWVCSMDLRLEFQQVLEVNFCFMSLTDSKFGTSVSDRILRGKGVCALYFDALK